MLNSSYLQAVAGDEDAADGDPGVDQSLHRHHHVPRSAYGSVSTVGPTMAVVRWNPACHHVPLDELRPRVARLPLGCVVCLSLPGIFLIAINYPQT